MVTRDVVKAFQIALAYGSYNFENFQNITHAHKSRNALAFMRFPIQIPEDNSQFIFVVKQGILSKDESESLGKKIALKWIALGRRLGFDEGELDEIQEKQKDLSEKGYQMLSRWKQREGTAAHYKTLYDALIHDNVQRKDLAEEYCCE